jgi:hypothetical protein
MTLSVAPLSDADVAEYIEIRLKQPREFIRDDGGAAWPLLLLAC